MQTVDTPTKYIEGIFVQELKNRFLCEVLIDGVSLFATFRPPVTSVISLN